MDFAAAANEIFAWAKTPTGALVIYPASALVGLGIGYCGSSLKKLYDKKFHKPYLPRQGIERIKLPKREPT